MGASIPYHFIELFHRRFPCYRGLRCSGNMKPLSKSEKEVLEVIGKKLKDMRIKKGYKSYETFAFDNDINRMQYWRMEKGLSNMSMATLLRIMEGHKISLKEFFKDFV